MIEILEPVASADLTTVSAAKTELGVTDRSEDERIQALIARASAIVTKRAGRVFRRQSVRETLSLDCRRDALLLRLWPVVTLSAVSIDGVEDLVGNYAASTSGMVRRRDGAHLPAGEYVVEYQAGFDDIPADVEAAVLLVVRHLYFSGGRDPAARAETVDGVGSTQFADVAVTAQIDALVGDYRAPNIG